MNKNTRLASGGLALALGLGTGCGAGSESPRLEGKQPPGQPPPQMSSPSPTSAQVDASIQESLARLSALEIVSVGGLVLNLPDSARACYNLPCPGDAQAQAAYDAEKARQAPRLAALAAQAEQCNSGNCYLSAPTSADEAVSALNALQIVQVEGLIVAQPANNPACYNLPCGSDITAANSENAHRAAVAFTAATTLKQEGI